MQELQTAADGHKSEAEALQVELAAARTAVTEAGEQSGEVEDLQGKLAAVRAEVAALEEEKSGLEEKVRAAEAASQEQQERIDRMQEEIESASSGALALQELQAACDGHKAEASELHAKIASYEAQLVKQVGVSRAVRGARV